MIQPTSIPIDIVGSSNPGKTKKISVESTYNMIISDNNLVCYSGYQQIKKAQNEYTGRALFYSTLGDFMVAVFGDSVYKVQSSNTVTGDLLLDKIGTLNTTAGDVDIDQNGSSQIVFSDSFNYYVWDFILGTFETHDVQGQTPHSLSQALGYIAVTALDKNTFFYTAVNDAINFPIDNAGEIGADKIECIKSFKDQFYVFGGKKTKVWTNRGLDVNPFQLDQTQIYDYGCINKASVAVGYGYIVWLAITDSAQISLVASIGGEPYVLSTDGISEIFSNLTNTQDCSGFLWQEDSHVFYHFTFYSDNISMVYDFSQKAFFYVTDEFENYHIAKKIVKFKNRYYFISFNDTYIYTMGSEITSYNGSVIPRIRITKSITLQTNELFRLDFLEIMAEQGIATDQMYIDIAISTDGGETFGNYYRQPMAILGCRNWAMRYRKLGAARDFRIMFRFIGLSRFVLLSCNGMTS